MKKQIELIRAHNGIISILVHPDYIIEPRAQDVYRNLLGYVTDLRDHNHLWTPLPGEVAAWWRLRSRMELVCEGGKWRVEGPGKERASVAYAYATGDSVTFSQTGEERPSDS